jgi:hypothetical protein
MVANLEVVGMALDSHQSSFLQFKFNHGRRRKKKLDVEFQVTECKAVELKNVKLENVERKNVRLENVDLPLGCSF